MNIQYFKNPWIFTDICTIYNMSGRVVSDIQTRAEGESLYIRYNTDANVVNDFLKFINNS